MLSLKIVLESNGFKIQAFTDPILALRNFTAGSYDFGPTWYKNAQNNWSLSLQRINLDNKIRVCFLSAISNCDEFVKCFPTINQVIVKPVDTQTLIQRINEVMRLWDCNTSNPIL